MRAVHQSLTGEAAAVLKLALGLARGRGHAQVTPLHVAFTLLGSSVVPYGLLRRACARTAHPGLDAQCRALELCFNVALNRLPTTHAAECPSTPFAAASLVLPTPPTLSNALVAALKRAQASQRRRCVELQSQTPSPPPATQQQQQQTLLTIKVELDQLIVSILDDPSVSRVMREASFSSAAVKACLEEETSLGHHGSASSSLQFLMNQPDAAAEPEPESPRCICTTEADVRAILEVMSSRRKQGTRRSNPVVIGDSASAAEASVAELMRRLETGGGDVPDELRGARVLRLHLSHARVRLMARADVDAWAADLRRTVAKAKAKVVYVGDMRWAVVDDDDQATTPRYYSAADHMAAALAQLLGELRASGSGRAWLVAAASYQTYVRCQRRALMTTWALQPVSVPAGAGLGLALGPRAASLSSTKDSNMDKLAHLPLLDLEPRQEDSVAALCVECARNLESEASVARAKTEGTNLALGCFPGCPQADEPQTSHKDDPMELKRKWSRLCQRAHLLSTAKPSSPGPCLSFETPTTCHGTSMVNHRDVETTLSLLPNSVETSSNHEVYWYRSEEDRPEVQESDMTIKSCDKENIPRRPWLDEFPSGDLKRKAMTGRPPCESKRRRGSGGLDLNLCAEGEEDDVDGSEARSK